MLNFFLITGSLLFLATNGKRNTHRIEFDDSDAPFTNGEVEIIRGYFENNIGYTGAFEGCVVASPSNTNPNYLYHWQRDAAISMHTLQYTAPNTSTFDKPFQNYVEWVLHVQALSDPNGIDVLGEPKFNTDGSVFTGGWCRPQNDGPASRATALTAYAFWLISQNRTDYVKEYLYTPQKNNTSSDNKNINSDNDTDKKFIRAADLGSCDSVGDAERVDCGYYGINEQECESTGCCWGEIDNNPNNYPWCYYPNMTTPTKQPTTPAPTAVGSDAIPTDLNYVMQNWQESDNCDLWEEQTGTHWYTLMVQRHALIYGASLASHFGDDTLAASWNKTAASMVSEIESFDNGSFISEGTRQLDCSIIVGTLYGGSDGLYAPTDTSVLNTMAAISSYWDGEYQINTDDTNAGIPGVLIGRYEADTYDGCLSDGGGQGHAWILCTNAMGDVYYRNGEELANDNNKADDILGKNGEKLKVYSKILKRNFPNYSEKLETLASNWAQGYLNNKEKHKIKNELARYMTTSGDDQLSRVKYHIESCNYHMSEQICETNGKEIGAYDLTWSYGTFLSAWYYRSQAINQGAIPIEREISVNWDLINKNKNNNNDPWKAALNGNDDPICAGCSNQCGDR